MRAQTILRLSVGFYIVLFFGYLFGPLVIMSITAFNSSTFPAVSPWDCLSGEWFGVLVKDDKIMTGLRNSLLIGAGVVMVAVPIGLAGANFCSGTLILAPKGSNYSIFTICF